MAHNNVVGHFFLQSLRDYFSKNRLTLTRTGSLRLRLTLRLRTLTIALSPYRLIALSPYRPIALSPYHLIALSPYHPIALSPYRPIALSPYRLFLGCLVRISLRRNSMSRWVYIWVVIMLSCPSICCMARRLAPPSKRCVAKE